MQTPLPLPLPLPLPAVFTAAVAHTSHTFKTRADETLLQAAELAGGGMAAFGFDSSCRNGTCRACACQLLAGEVTYRIKWPGLSLDEKRDGLILPCVAYPLSDITIGPMV